jgi:hypothetical protein
MSRGILLRASVSSPIARQAMLTLYRAGALMMLEVALSIYIAVCTSTSHSMKPRQRRKMA